MILFIIKILLSPLAVVEVYMRLIYSILMWDFKPMKDKLLMKYIWPINKD